MGISASEKCINKNDELQNIEKNGQIGPYFMEKKSLNNEKNDCLGNER